MTEPLTPASAATILETMAALTPAEAHEVVGQLQGILDALPKDESSTIRAALEGFVIGYRTGREAGRQEQP